MANSNREQTPQHHTSVNSFSKGMVTDMDALYVGEGVWTSARNAVNNSHLGEAGVIGNEQSNVLITKATYGIIGCLHKNESEWVIFSTDDTYGEIGIFNEHTKSYVRLANDNGFEFKKTNLIGGAVKKNKDCTYTVYWQDRLNPDRSMNLDKIPYLKTGTNLSTDKDCNIPEYSKGIDVKKLLLSPIISVPRIRTVKSNGGQLLNGSYQAVVAYSVDGVRVTSYFGPGEIQSLWNHSGAGSSLDILIEDLDLEFDEIEVVIISTINGQTVSRKLGNYSTRQNKITVDSISQTAVIVSLSTIPLSNPTYHKSDNIFTLNGYLLRSGVTTIPDFNYQPLANSIVSKWVAVEYPASYYENGGNKVVYMTDEIYAFFIRWIYTSGTKSASYHIPGRKALPTDLTIATGKDIISGETKRWQVENTASLITTPKNQILPDGGKVVLTGNMAYCQSSEKYVDNKPEIWGELCGKQIRHHKFPDNSLVNIHSKDGKFINLLGVKFENIQHPVDINGKPIGDIVGYEILRGSREGNKSVIAKGVFNNLWEYDIEGNETVKGIYQNFPYNDLRPNKLLRTVLKKDGGNRPDHNSSAPSKFRKDMYSFHSPDTTFNKPFLSGCYVNLYTQESGLAKSRFEIPFEHPKGKLITDGAFVMSALIGLGIALQSAMGKMSFKGDLEAKAGASFFGLIKAEVTKGSTAGYEGGTGNPIAAIALTALNTPAYTIASLVEIIPKAMYYGALGVDAALQTMYAFTGFKDYGLQLNSHAFYNKSSVLAVGNRRRQVLPSSVKYIDPFVQDFSATERVNNLFRNKYVAVKIEGEFSVPTVQDNTRFRVRDLADSPHSEPWAKEYTSNTSTFYGALKYNFDNQYGQLESIVQIPLDGKVNKTEADKYGLFSSEVSFGGDIYINRYTEKNPYMFFNTWMQGQKPGTEFNYKNYINGPAPRYWANFDKYDMADFDIQIKFKIKGGGIKMKTPSDLHHLDRDEKKSSNWFMLKHSWFYLSYNGVRDFFVESEINLAHRDYGEKPTERHYDAAGYTDLKEMFRSDRITAGNFCKYDFSLSASKVFNNFVSWGSLLPSTFDPYVSATCYQYYPKRVVYSLQAHNEDKQDQWKQYLANNYKDFNYKVNQVKSLNETGSLILFENGEPLLFRGVDTLQSTGNIKYTVGDGGLFSDSTVQGVVNADDSLEYGSCQSLRGAINTPYGMFYISQKAGKVNLFDGSSIKDISRGLKFWFADNLPSRLLADFPDFPLSDNPVHGVGCQAIYCSRYELLYFCKKDYKVIKEGLKMDSKGFYYIQNTRVDVKLGDPLYFEDCSWTRSYDPKTNSWLSAHDWHPGLVIPSYNGFITVKEDGFWKHNDCFTSYCNFYGKDYPFEVEFTASTGVTATTLKSVEYTLENYRYHNDGKDGYMILDHNFDRAVLYNNEQISGWLKLNITPKNNPMAILKYPAINGSFIDILYSKEENKYRFNQFWDITRDRGEFTNNAVPMWKTRANGYEKTVNPIAVNYSKKATERKKFRNYNNSVLLRRNISGGVKMLLKAFSIKQTPSAR